MLPLEIYTLYTKEVREWPSPILPYSEARS